MPDPITILGLSDDWADEAGGRLLTISGDFLGQAGLPYEVHVGPLGTVADPKAQSGIPGQGSILYPQGESSLECYLPRQTAVGMVSVLIRRVDGTREQLVPLCLEIMPRQFNLYTYRLLSLLPPYYAVGARSLETERPVV